MAPVATASLTCAGCETRLAAVYEPGDNPAVVAWHVVHCPVQACRRVLKVKIPVHLITIEPGGAASAWTPSPI